ncbi:adenosylcobalamin-dependent ribonucleoside-diphosphate reductase [Candidatus Woesearchaeota archaeon]|nr:adenosylcobalamin-dependent ribonucleoside-diphosphate reductase [Candidatus Woesearchaeota archaeon]
MAISKVKKRDGTIVKFKVSAIANAVEKAMLAVGKDDENLPNDLAEKVAAEVNRMHDPEYVPNVEEIQDIVEKVLISSGHAEIAKAYILYRQKRAEIRKLKQNILGKIDDSKLGINGLLIAQSRYLQKEETPKEMFIRVARAIASVEEDYGKSPEDIKKIEEQFYDLMSSLEFLPSGRILRGAGTKESMLYSSFVIPVADSMKGVFRALYDKALIQRLGGGTGFSFSRLRPKGRMLSSSVGYAAGPVAFIKLFDHASDLTVHAGNRKPANMGSLCVEHPDIVEFITMKDRREIRNFNISVEITDRFMDAVKEGKKYELKDPNSGRVIDVMDANNIFHLIVTMAWKTGDPGVLFIDRINEANPLPEMGRIETTDPCGDQLLLPYDGGNLGALNLAKFVRNRKIKWKQMEEAIRLGVRFLDNVVDASRFPVKKIETMVKENRRIGLGVMGFADMLYKLRIPYDSEKALETAEKIMRYFSSVAKDASEDLAREKGAFPLWNQSIFNGKTMLRNCSLLAIAPTGSRSILAEASPGIEPNFGLGYTRKILGTTEIQQVNKVLENVLKEYDVYSEEVIRKIVRTGALDGFEIPEEVKRVFVTAHKISPEWHIKMQAVFQKYIDNAISKTINFPKSATIEEIRKAFMMAYDMGCRGITVYRDGSLNEEVITVGR